VALSPFELPELTPELPVPGEPASSFELELPHADAAIAESAIVTIASIAIVRMVLSPRLVLDFRSRRRKV
jgi:hypothetical protein